jgi:hypothetical protein
MAKAARKAIERIDDFTILASDAPRRNVSAKGTAA